jgi:NADH-quinone oxidoreductase subunit D
VVARASGLDLDLRRDQPSLAYPALMATGALHIPTATAGDAAARLHLLVAQTAAALDLVAACLDALDRLGPGPLATRLPTTLRVPQGATTSWLETPLGVAGVHLVSRGGAAPWRLKLRTPSFALLGALEHILPGTRVNDLPLVLASLPFVQGDADR